MKNLENLYQDVLEDIQSLGIPVRTVFDVKSNGRFKRTWGLCSATTNNGVRGFVIQVSTSLLADDLDDMAAKNTIAHELLHTIKGCMNHGPEWNKYARMLDVFGYSIHRATSCADKGIDPNSLHKYKYEITCKKCGAVSKYYKMTKVVKMIYSGNTTNVHCGKCKCNQFIFKTL